MTAETGSAPALDYMAIAKRRVANQRRKKQLEQELKDVNEAIKADVQLLLTAMEAEQFQDSSRVDGATVYLYTQVWAGPSGGDHARLTEALRAAGLDEYTPKTCNTQSLSAYVREEISKTDPTLPLDERARLALGDLAEALDITERRDVRVNGA